MQYSSNRLAVSWPVNARSNWELKIRIGIPSGRIRLSKRWVNGSLVAEKKQGTYICVFSLNKLDTKPKQNLRKVMSRRVAQCQRGRETVL